MRSRPKRMPNSCERVDVRVGGVIAATESRRERSRPPARRTSTANRATLARSASTSSAGALAVKRSFASLPCARSSSPRARASCSSRRARTSAGSSAAASTMTSATSSSTTSVGRGTRARTSAGGRRTRAAAPAARPGVDARLRDGGDRRLHIGLGGGVAVLGRPARERLEHQQAALARQVRPHRLGHERAHRMGQAQDPLERPEQVRRHVATRRRVGPLQARLGRLDVPVAEVEHEGVERLHRRRELVAVDQPQHLVERRGQPRAHPAVGGLVAGRRRCDRRVGLRDHEPGGVPELVGELRPLGDHALREAHVLGRAHLEEAVAGGIGAVGRHELERVDAGVERLRHTAAVGRPGWSR